jgi:hypothetical protein
MSSREWMMWGVGKDSQWTNNLGDLDPLLPKSLFVIPASRWTVLPQDSDSGGLGGDLEICRFDPKGVQTWSQNWKTPCRPGTMKRSGCRDTKRWGFGASHLECGGTGMHTDISMHYNKCSETLLWGPEIVLSPSLCHNCAGRIRGFWGKCSKGAPILFAVF